MKMKNLIASLLLGLFSFLFVMPLTSFAQDVGTVKELVKKADSLLSHSILDGVTPSVAPQYGKMTTFLLPSPTLPGYLPKVVAMSNSPPQTEGITNKEKIQS